MSNHSLSPEDACHWVSQSSFACLFTFCPATIFTVQRQFLHLEFKLHPATFLTIQRQFLQCKQTNEWTFPYTVRSWRIRLLIQRHFLRSSDNFYTWVTVRIVAGFVRIVAGYVKIVAGCRWMSSDVKNVAGCKKCRWIVKNVAGP